jgi:hypothetical protein
MKHSIRKARRAAYIHELLLLVEITAKVMAEKGRFGAAFGTLFHQSRPRLLPPRVPRVRASTADLLTFSTSFLITPLPSPTHSEGPILGSSSSLPKMGFSPIYLRVLARSIYGTVFPTGLRPCQPGTGYQDPSGGMRATDNILEDPKPLALHTQNKWPCICPKHWRMDDFRLRPYVIG